jgi:hypothetical protein
LGRIISAVLHLLLAFGATVYAQGAPRLTAADLAWPRLREDADSGAVRRVFGVPRARDVWFTASDGEQAPRWYYAKHNVYYDVGAQSVIAVEFTKRGLKTRRGLQVGDSVTGVRALYGTPPSINEYEEAGASEDVWRYPGRNGVLTLRVRGGRVQSIVLGSSLTNE